MPSKFVKFYSEHLKRNREALLNVKNYTDSNQNNFNAADHYKDKYYTDFTGPNINKMAAQVFSKIFESPDDMLNRMREAANDIEDAKLKQTVIKQIQSIMAANPTSFEQIVTEINNCNNRIKEKSHETDALGRTRQVMEDNHLDIFTPVFNNMPMWYGEDFLEPGDEEFEKQQNSLPLFDEFQRQYQNFLKPLSGQEPDPGIGKNLIEQPLNEEIGQLKAGVDENAPDADQLKKDLDEINLLTARPAVEMDKLNGKYEELTGGRATSAWKRQQNMAERNTYKNGKYKNFLYDDNFGGYNSFMELQESKGEVTRESLEEGAQDLFQSPMKMDGEYKRQIIDLCNDLEKLNPEIFANPEEIQRHPFEESTKEYGLKGIISARKKLEDSVKKADADRKAGKPVNYQELRQSLADYKKVHGEYQKLFDKAAQVFHDSADPALSPVNVDTLRNRNAPMEFSYAYSGLVNSKVSGLFHLILAAKKCGVTVEQLLERPYGITRERLDQYIGENGIDSIINSQNPSVLADGASLNETKSRNMRRYNWEIGSMNKRGFAGVGILDPNMENVKQNALDHEAAKLVEMGRTTREDQKFKEVSDILQNPASNPAAYSAIYAANLLGAAGKVSLELPKEYDKNGGLYKKGELPEVGQYAAAQKNLDYPGINYKLSNALTAAQQMKNSGTEPFYPAGCAAAVFRILRDKDMSKPENQGLYNTAVRIQKEMKVRNPGLKTALKAAEEEFKLGQALRAKETEGKENAFASASVSSLYDSMGKFRGMRGSSDEFNAMNDDLKKLSTLAKKMYSSTAKKTIPTQEQQAEYDRLVNSVIKKGDIYLNKKHEQMNKTDHSRSDYERNRVIAVSRLVDRLKKEAALTPQQKRFMHQSEQALRSLHGDYMNAAAASKGEVFEYKCAAVAWALTGRIARDQGYTLNEGNFQDFAKKLANSKDFQAFVKSYQGAQLAYIVEDGNYNMQEFMRLAQDMGNQAQNQAGGRNLIQNNGNIKNTEPQKNTNNNGTNTRKNGRISSRKNSGMKEKDDLSMNSSF